MTRRQLLILLIPSSLWGSSYMFMRYLSPIYGPILTATIRISVATVVLIAFLYLTGKKLHFKRDYKLLSVIGITNSAIPFTLYAFAALYIPSSLSVIINSTAPMFGTIFGLLLLKDKFNNYKAVGLLLGTIGVGFVSSDILATPSLELYLSVFACIMAALLYGFSGVIVKKYATHIEPTELTTGSLLFASIAMMIVYTILLVTNNTPAIQSSNLALDISIIVLFGILCTSIPYIAYYKLLQEVGPTNALMVTYLMPVFGMMWGVIGGENITLFMIIGLVIIISGIYIISRKEKKQKTT